MKKILIPAFLLLSLCMVGCSKDKKEEPKKDTETPKETTYKCDYNGEDGQGTMEATLDGDDVTKITISLSETYDDEDELDDAYSMYQFGYGMLNSINGISAKVNKSGKTININGEMIIKDIPNDELVDIFNSSKVTKDIFKEYAEEQNFICK